MPERWWVPIPGVDPARVKPAFVHAAITRWFDDDEAEHEARDKPYVVSALAADADGGTGVEIGVLTMRARQRLLRACAPGSMVRLGNQSRPLGTPSIVHACTWAELAEPSPVRAWRLDLLTPATFKNGDRCAPLPQVTGMLRTLAHSWETFADTPCPQWRPVAGDLWAADLELRSVVVRMPMGRRAPGREITVSAATGWFVLRAATEQCAARAGPLIALAAYTGIGAMTRKGLGVVRVTPLDRTGRPAAETAGVSLDLRSAVGCAG